MNSALGLTTEERRELESLTRSRRAAAADAKRARLVIMLDQGSSWSTISREFALHPRLHQPLEGAL